MDNMRIYNHSRTVPENAQKKITGGKLNGMTDINPMWRIKTLTELFGACGYGWGTKDERFEVMTAAGGEIVVMCTLRLWIRDGDETSSAIFGVGGSKLVALEKGQPVTNDEAYKMAYTDAISVACKALGFGADIYYQKDRTKYSTPEPPTNPIEMLPPVVDDELPWETIPTFRAETEKAIKELNIRLDGVAKMYGVRVADLTEEHMVKAIAMKREAITKKTWNELAGA